MNKIISSRKLWGALLGSFCLMGVIKITPDIHMATAIMIVGGLWGAAIGGQAYSDILKEKKI